MYIKEFHVYTVHIYINIQNKVTAEYHTRQKQNNVVIRIAIMQNNNYKHISVRAPRTSMTESIYNP